MASVARHRERGTASGQRRPRAGMRWWEWVQAFFGIVIMLILGGTIAGVLYAAHLLQTTAETLGSFEALVDYRPGGITEVYATDKDPKTGKNILLGRVYGQYREYLPIEKVPDVVKFATIAIEDERFYEHQGVDLHGIARAVYSNYKSGKMSQGASTLTQQLARNLILKNNKKTLDRKLQEMLLSVRIERKFSKDEILEMYLNEVCYGKNTYGIQAASKVFFNKSVYKLTLSEAAMLAGLPQRPSAFEPFNHFDQKKKKWKDELVLDRRDAVLSKMLEVKQDDASRRDPIISDHLKNLSAVTPDAIKAAKKARPILAPEPDPANTNFKAPWFTNYVLKQLVDQYGAEKVYNGGLKVYTTLNYEMQKEAERALINGVMKGNDSGVTEGALITVEPTTGYIRAMVGGVDYKKSKFNNTVQGRRQPGSSFKAFVYTAALASGKFTPDSYIDDSPISFSNGWSPKNYGGGYHGTVSLRTAFKFSYNVPAVKIARDVRMKSVLDVASAMGVDTSRMNANNLALALGAGEVTPLEMASAYSTFPNQGNHAKPMAIIRVVDAEGNDLPGFEPQIAKQVVPPSVVRDMSSLLADVVQSGTAASAAGIHEVPNAHGKTGTTNDNRDAWFVGYTPELSTAVWVCGLKRIKKGDKIIPRYVPMQGVTGGVVCAPIWARFMKAAVPIQQRFERANRITPEQAIPKNAAITAVLNSPSPSPSPDAEAGAPTPEPAPTPVSLTVPRASESEETVEPEEEKKSPEGMGNNSGDANSTGTENTNALNTEAGAANARGSDVNGLVGRRTSAIGGAPTTAAVTTPIGTTSVTRASTLRAVGNAGRAVRQPETVEVCPESGGRATRWCPVGVARTFAPGTAPRGFCKKHKPMPGDG